jgi:hypothetical protein
MPIDHANPIPPLPQHRLSTSGSEPPSTFVSIAGLVTKFQAQSGRGGDYKTQAASSRGISAALLTKVDFPPTI